MRATSIMSMPMPRIISIVQSPKSKVQSPWPGMSPTLDFGLRTLDSSRSAPVVRHQPQHLLHGGRESNRDGAADDAVADVQLDEVRHAMQQRQILVVEAVPGVDLQAERVRLLRAGDQSFQLGLASRLLVEPLGESAGVQLNELAARARRGFNLRRIG